MTDSAIERVLTTEGSSEGMPAPVGEAVTELDALPPESRVQERRARAVVVEIRPSAPPTPGVARRASVDAEGRALKQDFEATDFETMSDADFASHATEFAARARLRQATGLVVGSLDLENRIIRRLTALAHERRLPRPVFGLSRTHTGDWAAIAKRARDERARRAASANRVPVTPTPSPATETAPRAEEDELDNGQPLDVPRLRALAVKGDILLVGGTVKNDKLDRVRRRTGIAIEWVGLDAGKSAAAVASLAKRIRAGKVSALVLLNGLLNHKQSEPVLAAAREVDLPLAYADKAGTGSLDRAIGELERRLRERAA